MTYECQITIKSDACDVEFVAYTYPLQVDGVCLPQAPGAAVRDGQEPILLHVAPGRWFAPAASEGLRAQLLALSEYGALNEVEGKWQRFNLEGRDSTAVLAETIDIVAILKDRDCAAVHLFDCPSIVTPVIGGYAVWTRASHRLHLQTEFKRLTER
jgi:hypothetical protein